MGSWPSLTEKELKEDQIIPLPRRTLSATAIFPSQFKCHNFFLRKLNTHTQGQGEGHTNTRSAAETQRISAFS